MNKTDLANVLAGTCGLTTSKAETIVNTFIQAITDALTQGDTVALSGFGNFGVKVRAARTGRNPQSGETLQIPKTTVAYFKPGSKLKAAVNGETGKL